MSNTLKASELRIGNLVYQGEYYGHKQISAYQIYQLSILGNGQDYLVAEYYKKFEPIPLTEEWLVRFGFTKRKQERFFMELCYYNEHYNLYPNENGSVTFNDDAGSGCTIAIIKYVHQLQNLYFALTGEELTIKE